MVLRMLSKVLASVSVKILASILVLFGIVSAAFVIYEIKNRGDIVVGTGTVVFHSMEGGFYGIISDDGECYDPVNLEQEFKVDGLRVYFEARILRDAGSIHMWGHVISILKIQKLE